MNRELDRTTAHLIKKHFPSISNMSDQELSFVAARSRYSEFREETIFEKRDAAVSEDLRSTAQEVVSRESLMKCLNNLELPNGWGTILNSFTETLIGQIRSGLLTAEVFNATTDPILLLLRILLLYGISEHDEALHSIRVQPIRITHERLMPSLTPGQIRVHALNSGRGRETNQKRRVLIKGD